MSMVFIVLVTYVTHHKSLRPKTMTLHPLIFEAFQGLPQIAEQLYILMSSYVYNIK